MTQPSPDPVGALFASRSVPRHLLRGVLGLTLMVSAFALIPTAGPVSLLLVLPAVVAWRGCPTCWALGLAQTRAQACPLPARR